MTMGSNIHQLRKRHQLTQRQFAEKMGVSEQAVSKWENDVCAPDISVIPKIANLFQVSIDRIFGFHLDAYEAQVKKIISDASEAVRNTTDNIMQAYVDYFTNALTNHPNSIILKKILAHYHYQCYALRAKEVSDTYHADKAISLCREIIANSLDSQELNSAIILLAETYAELGQTDQALAELDKAPLGRNEDYVQTKAEILYKAAGYPRNATHAMQAIETDEKYTHMPPSPDLQKHVEQYLYENIAALTWVNALYRDALIYQGNHEQAYRQNALQLKLLSLFDDGGSDLNLYFKRHTRKRQAHIAKTLGHKQDCAEAVMQYAALSEQCKQVTHHTVRDINRYFATLDEIHVSAHASHYPADEIDADIDEMKAKYADFLS